MARKAKEKTPEPKKEKRVFAVFISFPSYVSAVCVSSENWPTIEHDGTLAFYVGDVDDLVAASVFKEWSFYKEVKCSGDMDIINDWLENTKILES